MSADADDVIRQVTRLARSGALERAWSLFAASGLAAAEDNPKALSLRARLKKDRARLARGSERVRWLEQSAADYLRAAETGGGSYPLINAATLSLLAGRRQQAEQLARRVLDQLEAHPDEAETRYWLGATRAEALLLLGRLPEARAALRAAVAEAPLAWEDRAATIGQFALICAELGGDAGWLDRFRPPRSLHFTGIMRVPQSDPVTERRIADWLKAESVGFGFGALAAGADIWIAEALVARGAGLNVILPCPVDVFRERSVAAADPDWIPRFDRLLDAADSVDELDSAPAPSPAAVRLTDAVALGLAIHNARILQSEALGLRIAGDDAPLREEATGQLRRASFAASRRPGGAALDIAETGSTKAMLKAGPEGLQVFDGPAEAWAAASRLAAQGARVALDYRLVDDSAGIKTARLEAIADAAEPGQVLASKALAFALLAEAPAVRVETMGEIRAACGYFPLFALA